MGWPAYPFRINRRTRGSAMLHHCKPAARTGGRHADQGVWLLSALPGAGISGDVDMRLARNPFIWCNRTDVSVLTTPLDQSARPSAPPVFSESP